MAPQKLLLTLLIATIVMVATIGVGTSLFYYRSQQLSSSNMDDPAKSSTSADGTMPVRLSSEARKNLGIISRALEATTYWRKIDVPGVITDRPGISDRGVVAPVTGIVTKIHAYPGDPVAPNAALFSLRLISESLHTSQLELFKATKEIEIAKQQRKRLDSLAQTGGVAGSRIIEIENQIQRMDVNVQAYRQDLLARGLPTEQIEAAANGDFVTEIIVRAPSEHALAGTGITQPDKDAASKLPFSFELQTLKVELGQQVEAGGVLCNLADHRALWIEGRGFKKDMPLIQRAVKDKLPIDVAFEVGEDASWPVLPKQLLIHHVANLIDTQSRTFAFFLTLENQSQVYSDNRMLWRFRPGDRVRLSVAVEKVEDVFVLPQGAIVREGPEAFVFRQNGDLFDRMPVHVLHEDSSSIVVANDGGLKKGFYIAQNSAASLNRVLKAQLASGVPTNVHVHADGTVHAAH